MMRLAVLSNATTPVVKDNSWGSDRFATEINRDFGIEYRGNIFREQGNVFGDQMFFFRA